MRITFLNSLYPPHGGAGAENTLRLLARSFAAAGHACSIITLTPGRAAEVGEIDGMEVRYLPLANVYWPHGERRPAMLRPVFQAVEAYNPAMEIRVRRVLAALRPDVLNCHNLQGFSASAWRAAAGSGIPVVQTLHDYYAACPRSAMWRPASGNCASVCAECRIFAAPRRALSGTPGRGHLRQPSPVRSADGGGRVPARTGRHAAGAHHPRQQCRAGGALHRAAAPRILTLGFMGRIEPSKGLDTLIEAIGISRRESSRSASPAKRMTATRAALRESRGDASGCAVPRLCRAGRFLRRDRLPGHSVDAGKTRFPRVFHEALAFGVPSLVTPLGGLPEVIEHGRTGFVASGTDAGGAARGGRRAAFARHGTAPRCATRASPRRPPMRPSASSRNTRR